MTGSQTITYGLIGRSLGHSFSPQFFNDKFSAQGLPDRYGAFELPDLEGVRLLTATHPHLQGLNVTIPYKQAVVAQLDALVGPAARALQTVNCIRIDGGRWLGYNTDVHGIHHTLNGFLPTGFVGPALVLGTGGAAQAVGYALQHRAPSIPFRFVSRKPQSETLTYSDLTPALLAATPLVINTTPLGMHPEVASKPDLPYDAIGPGHFLFDLVYNPAETAFLKEGIQRGAKGVNGHAMLIAQAEASWAIWQGTAPEDLG